MLAIVLLVFFAVSVIAMAIFFVRHNNEPEIMGVSFSQVQAERYGVDWRKAYTATIEDLGFRHIRIATYWNRIEKSPNEYDFSELDYMVAEAERYNAKLKFVVGQKVIRWPECFYPDWLDKNNPEVVGREANELIAATVERYNNSPAIETWQVENEFLLKTFGECPKANLTNAALEKEIDTVRAIDQSRPIELTQSNQNGFPFLGPSTETFGFSMYRVVHNNLFGYFIYPQNGIYNWWKAALIEIYRNTQVTIHELQGEAWGHTGNEDLSWEEASKSMNPEQLRDNIAYARQTQIKTYYLWGAEWWYWLKETQDHPEMWQTVKDELQHSKTRQ
jgi:hypothetical protein